ncbi:MAG: hypothetical protein L6Q68_00855 [Aquabacterium sp.]|nr:hypothetical protein [Aquabacterium sp.]
MSAQTRNDRILSWWRPIGALVVGWACTSANAGFEDRTYDEQRVLAGDQMRLILQNFGVCGDVQDCRKKQLVFSSPTPGGFGIDVYSTTDDRIKKEIISACLEIFMSNPKVRRLDIGIFAGTFKTDDWSMLFKKRQMILTVRFEREE